MTRRQRLHRELAEAVEAARLAAACKLHLYRGAKAAGVDEEKHLARAESLARTLARTPHE